MKHFFFNKNHHEWDAACYITSDITYELNYFLPNEIENIKFYILMVDTHWLQLELFIDPQIVLNFLIFLEKIYLNSTQISVKFTFQAISTLTFLKTENMFAVNSPIIVET